MKRIVVLLATLLLSFGLTQAGTVSIAPGGDGFINDTLRTQGQACQLDVSWDCDIAVFGASIGIEVYGLGGATWNWLGTGTHGASTIVTMVHDLDTDFDMTGLLITEQDIDEAGADTIMAGGVAMFVGVANGTNALMYSYNFEVSGDGGDENWIGTLCFDSCFVPPSGAFVFVDDGGNAIAQGFSGEMCLPVAQPRNFCPTFDDTYGPLSVSHCDILNFTVSATDPEIPPDVVAYSGVVTSGNGALVVDGASGAVAYTPASADVGSAVQLTIRAWDPAFHGEMDCAETTVDITVTNLAPAVVCGDGGKIGMGNTFTNGNVGSDPDPCDVVTYSVAATPAPVGAYAIDGNGDFSFDTDLTDGGQTFTFTVTVDDGFATANCSFDVEVLENDPFELVIEKTHATLQGHFVDVDIYLTKGSEDFGGFDLLIGYDASGLAFTEATLGGSLIDCGWEYFTYRYNWNGNCGNACPSGLVRVVGLAETNNGPNHPICTNPKTYPVTLATLTFYVSNDRTLECMYLPIRFYWFDCGDNTMSSVGGDTLFVNDRIFDGGFDDPMYMNEIQDMYYGFPTYFGVQWECMEGGGPDKPTPIDFIDMINGGVDVVCADSIDARGDINLNGVSNEIADAVMFTNYFINGLSAFVYTEGSIAASDVNADGIALSVADLVYLVRVIVGDANPYPKPMPDALAEIDFQHNTITMDAPVNVGAALFTFQVNGEIGTPTLADGISMDIKSAVNGDELRVLVYNIGTNAIPVGNHAIVNVPGNVELVSAEVAAYDGFGIDAMVRNLPASFAVMNYPNPFNPQTTIALDLPVASDWSVKIYNVAGQMVKDYNGYNEAGTLNVVWDGTDSNNSSVASGIYFYKVEASNYSVTKKMMLMK